MLKILVVEDETVIRTALRRLLERNGYQVSEAGSVQEAESSHELEEFDLIISDLRLPGAAGTDLIRKAGDVPVLIMTSYASLRSAVPRYRSASARPRACPKRAKKDSSSSHHAACSARPPRAKESRASSRRRRPAMVSK